MTHEARKLAQPLSIGGAQIHLRTVRLREDITIDELHLDGSDLVITSGGTADSPVSVQAAETRIHVMMSESNLNTMLAANVPSDGLVRNLRFALLSGKARITGQFAKSVVHLPFTVEVVPLVENGVRIKLDIQSARSGFTLPAALLDVLEQWINNNRALPFDLTLLPVPVKVDEIRCEPGRLIVKARARLSWPTAAEIVTIAPFTAASFPEDRSQEPPPLARPEAQAPSALPQV